MEVKLKFISIILVPVFMIKKASPNSTITSVASKCDQFQLLEKYTKKLSIHPYEFFYMPHFSRSMLSNGKTLH